MLFIDFSSAFKTIIPHRLVDKLIELGSEHPTVSLESGLLNCQATGCHGCHGGQAHLQTLALNTGIPQACVLSPLLYSLYA